MSLMLRCLAAATLAVTFFATTSSAQTAGKTRYVYSANNGTALPGVLRRSEGQGQTGDADIDATYDAMGDFYDAYWSFWNRNSYDNAGALLRATVHYSVSYCNATSDSTSVILGDGDAANGCRSPARSRDAVVHELTHLLTQNESSLGLGGEAGALNEALSDISAAFVKAWVDGGRNGTLAVSADTWKIGEEMVTPALRFMNDPAADGVSADYWSLGVGGLPRQYGAGVANLAFYLMSQGGTHPRGSSTITVAGMGMDKAVRVFYKANVDYLGPSSGFMTAATATVNAAAALSYSAAEQESVANAWRAVGVGVLTGEDGEDVTLTNGVAVTGLSGGSGSQKFFKLTVPAGKTTLRFQTTGGTGDVDLYVRSASRPTLSVFNCRSWTNTNLETCSFNAPAAGTYYVMLYGYRAYSGVSLTGTYATPPPPADPDLTNGVPVTGLSGSAGDQKFWRIAVPAGRPLTVTISGGAATSGDADLYVRRSVPPTTTSYDCRPYLNGNNEICRLTSTSATDYHIMVRAYSSYVRVTLTATY